MFNNVSKKGKKYITLNYKELFQLNKLMLKFNKKLTAMDYVNNSRSDNYLNRDLLSLRKDLTIEERKNILLAIDSYKRKAKYYNFKNGVVSDFDFGKHKRVFANQKYVDDIFSTDDDDNNDSFFPY